MEFIDTHAHLYTDEFLNDRDEVLQRAKDEGIKKIILPAIDSKSHQAMIDFSAEHPELLFPLMGLHPTSVKEDYKKELEVVENYLSEGSLFHGIGEIGIDLYWDKTHFNEQVDAFKTQVDWAKGMRWPIVIHTRDSFTQVFKVLEPMLDGNLTGIFHCFGGTMEEAQLIQKIGFLMGIGGVLTFKNSSLPAILEHVDINHLVLETDSPYLAPTPYRGKRNESSYLKLVAEKLAAVQQTSVSHVAKVTTKNALRVFNW